MVGTLIRYQLNFNFIKSYEKNTLSIIYFKFATLCQAILNFTNLSDFILC